jgi:hypothetical protein
MRRLWTVIPLKPPYDSRIRDGPELPKTAPTIGGKELSSMSLRFGMKSASTPYPDPFVASSNFEHDAYSIEVGMPQVLMRPAIIGDGFFVALTFHHPGNQVLIGKF